MLYDSPPSMSKGGFEFLAAHSEVTTTQGGDSAQILGSRMNPELIDQASRSTIDESYLCDPQQLGDYLTGNVVAISNPFYEAKLESGRVPLYLVTSPYKVTDIDYKKYKMIPLNPDTEYVRVHGKKEETEATLLTSTGRAQPSQIYAVPDIIVADACGFSEKILNRRI